MSISPFVPAIAVAQWLRTCNIKRRSWNPIPMSFNHIVTRFDSRISAMGPLGGAAVACRVLPLAGSMSLTKECPVQQGTFKVRGPNLLGGNKLTKSQGCCR
ncbi:hypothetical protein Tco_0481429 [Tanacetum coccineum]